MFSDVTEDVVVLLNQVRADGFAVRHLEDLTDQWKQYYLEALWREEISCPPVKEQSAMCCSCAKGCEGMDLTDRILELSRYGYFCSQILAILLLETIGRKIPSWCRPWRD